MLSADVNESFSVNEEHRRANERAVLWNKPMQYRPTITTAIPYHVQQGKPQMYPFHGIRHGYPPAPSSSQIKHDVQSKQNQPANIYHIDVKHPDVRPDIRQTPYDSMATLRRDQMPIYQIQMGQNPGQVNSYWDFSCRNMKIFHLPINLTGGKTRTKYSPSELWTETTTQWKSLTLSAINSPLLKKINLRFFNST